MEDQTLIDLKATLIGFWESPVMLLEFYGNGSNEVATGKVTSVGNQRAIDFDYDVINDAGSIMLRLNTTMAGAMEYQITQWKPGALTLIKRGFPTELSFVKKAG